MGSEDEFLYRVSKIANHLNLLWIILWKLSGTRHHRQWLQIPILCCRKFLLLTLDILQAMTNGWVAQWCGVAALQCQSPRFDPDHRRWSVWSLYVFPVTSWVFSRCCNFLQHSKDAQVCSLIGFCKTVNCPCCVGQY